MAIIHCIYLEWMVTNLYVLLYANYGLFQYGIYLFGNTDRYVIA